MNICIKEKYINNIYFNQTMKHEELMIVMKDLIFQVNNLLREQNHQTMMLNGLMEKGLIFEKRVSKFAQSSGAIYVPKRLIGQSFKIVLIPLDDVYGEKLPKRESHESIEKREKENIKKDDEIRKRLI